MRRFIPHILRALLFLGMATVVLIGLLFIPSVQKSLLVRALSGPETEVSIEEVRLRPGSAAIGGFALTTPETRIGFVRLDARFRPMALLFRRTAHIDSLTVSELVVETFEPEEPAELPDWETFGGMLPRPPIDFHLGAVAVDGRYRSPGDLDVAFTVNGSNLDSRGSDGGIEIALEAETGPLPGQGKGYASIEVHPRFDDGGDFQQLCADGWLGESPGGPRLLHARLCAEQTDTGETYRVHLVSPDGPEPDHVLLEARAEWRRDEHEADGDLALDLDRHHFPSGPLIEPLPDFSLAGKSRFAVSGSGELHIESETGARLADTAARFGLPEQLDEFRADLSFVLTASPERLVLTAWDLGVAGSGGDDLLRATLPTEIAIDFGPGGWGLPERDEPVLLLAIPGLRPELLNLFLGDHHLASEPLTGEFAVYSRNGRFELETEHPLSLKNAALEGPGGQLLRDTDVFIRPAGWLAATGFDLGITIDASMPQLRALSVTTQTRGDLPLDSIDSRLRLAADGLAEDIPFSALDVDATLRTTHRTGHSVPTAVTVHLAAEGTPRPETPTHLPARLALEGKLERRSGETPYTLDIVLPGPDNADAVPFATLDGRLAPDGSETAGTLRWTLPDWLTNEFAARNENVRTFHGSGEIDYAGAWAPLDLHLDSGVAFDLDTGRSDLPGNGRLSLEATAAIRGHEWIDLESLRASVTPAGEEAMVRVALLQSVSIDPDAPVYDRIPTGDLLAITFGGPPVTAWIPPGPRGELGGGFLRGTLLVSREGEGLHLHPEEATIAITGIRTGTEATPLDLTLDPRMRYTENGIDFGLDRVVLSTGNTSILEASLSGEWPLAAGAENELPRASVAAGGDLLSLRHLAGDVRFPELTHGPFELLGDVAFDPESARATWNASVELPRLEGAGDAFALAVNLEGETAGPESSGQLSATISHEDTRQDLGITFTHRANASHTSLPKLEMRGSSEYLDLVSLERLGNLLVSPTEPTPSGDEPSPAHVFLPVELDAEFTVAELRVMPEFLVSDIRIHVIGDDNTLDLREARMGIPENGEVRMTATLTRNGDGLSLASSGSGANLAIDDLIRRTQGVADPDISGRFGFDFDLSSRGTDPGALPRNLDGVLRVTGEQGRLRLTIPDRRMERLRGILNVQEGAIGAIIARVAGAPPGIQALADCIDLLTDIPYRSIDVRLTLAEGRTLAVERMELAGAYLFANGTGRLEDIDLDAIEKTRLHLDIEIGAQRRLRDAFATLGLLSSESNPQGYQLLRQRPIEITGTLGEPNLRDLWDLLIQAGTGAATAREEAPRDEPGRRDPVDDAIEGIRDLFRR